MIKNKNHTQDLLTSSARGLGWRKKKIEFFIFLSRPPNLFLRFALGHSPMFSKRMKRKIKCLCTGYYLQFCLICSSLNGRNHREKNMKLKVLAIWGEGGGVLK